MNVKFHWHYISVWSIVDILHVLDTYKFKMDQINSKRETVKSSIFRPYLLPWKPVVRSSQISNSSKLSCMLSLPASMKRIRSRTAEKKWRHLFPIISLWVFFPDFQGQLTPQSVVQSGWNSNSSQLSCMPSLPASIKRNGWKTVEKKERHRFSHHNPISYHENQCSDLAEFQTHPSSHVCYHYLQVWKGSDQEQPRKNGDIIFPIISLCGFFQTFKGS